ncbi:radical SAM protein, partial [Candidatus Sumerlaeota bacterium]|nr:radical SAM protein [Candidatus Sumerlaeota bacterium]
LIALSGLLAREHSLTALDAMIERLSPQQAIARIAALDVDTIVFLTGAVSWDQDFACLDQLVKTTDRRYDCIGCGDILFAEDRRFLERYDYLKACVLDFTSPDLADWLADRASGQSAVGGPAGHSVYTALSYKAGDGTVVLASRRFSHEPFSLPLPRYDLFPYRRYRIPHGRHMPYAGVLASYGCPYRCHYCIGGELGFKLRDLDNMMEELRYLKRIGIRDLWFKDLVFGAPSDHYVQLLERMISDKLRFTWVCLSRANVLTEPLLALMKRAGCHTIQLGVETADDELLARYSKGLSTAKVRAAVAMCKRAGIRVLAHYMLGLPGDSEEKIEQTVRFALELDTEFASFNVVMPRMGTAFRAEALERGLISDDTTVLDNSRSMPVYDLPDLPRERLWQLRNRAIRRFHLRPSYVMRRLVGTRSLYELAELFREGLSLLLSTLR